MTNGTHPVAPVQYWGNQNERVDGLTKREYFAAMAMQGLLANSTDGYNTFGQVAESASLYADALIKELNKEGL